MTEPAQPPVTPAGPAPAQEPPQGTPSTPPWGSDFDPARAWHTIQTLREAEKERDQLRKQAVTPEQRQQLDEYARLVEASKTEAQRQAEAVEAAKRDAETARADAVRYKAAATHKIGDEHFDLLGTGTEAEVTARAEKIAALLAAQAAAATPPPPGAPATRPIEQMRPGATPSGMETEDDVLYAQLFGGTK